MTTPDLSATGLVPQGFRVKVSRGVRSWASGEVVIGGAPWRISRLAPKAQALMHRIHISGPSGLSLESLEDRSISRILLDRGFIESVAQAPFAHCDAQVVIPVFNNVENLRRVLHSLGGYDVLVVDDASTEAQAIERVARIFGARVVRHDVNAGPAAARNTGLAHTSASLIAFIDSDCVATPGWIEGLLHHFDDPRVGAVAPRVKATDGDGGLLDRYERVHSSLDMGTSAELVRSGARLGFIPSAALVVRRSALADGAFDEGLRLGEDVDLVWRLGSRGWLVRYDPSVKVFHRSRTKVRQWMKQRFTYGTSAPDLERRHPGGLAPARLSAWNVATLAALAVGRPRHAAMHAGATTALLWWSIRDLPTSPVLAVRVVGQGIGAEYLAAGHMLRREWWPLGWALLAVAPRSRPARVVAGSMLAPLAWEWYRRRPAMDPLTYSALRLLDDAAYGTGVIAASVKRGTFRTLLPRIRLPWANQRA